MESKKGKSGKSDTKPENPADCCIIVLVMAAGMDEARRIGKTLVHERLAACANIIPGVESLFFWENRFCIENEILVMMKTRCDLFETLKERVQSLHSYEVPEIIALPVTAGSEEYLGWVSDTTAGNAGPG